MRLSPRARDSMAAGRTTVGGDGPIHTSSHTPPPPSLCAMDGGQRRCVGCTRKAGMHDNIGAGLRAGPCRAGQHSLESARSVGARLLQEGLIRDEILGAGGAAGNMHGCVRGHPSSR